MKILVAEDAEDDQLLMREAFKAAGLAAEIEMVEDGQKAVEFLESRPAPLLVVLDLKMPLKNGLETLEWIRGRPRFDAVAVLILTASNRPGDIEAAYRLRANAFLVKPSSLSELMRLVACLRDFWLGFNRFPPAPREP